MFGFAPLIPAGKNSPASLKGHPRAPPQAGNLARQNASTGATSQVGNLAKRITFTERKPREAKSRTHALRAFFLSLARVSAPRATSLSLTLHGLLARLRGALEHRGSRLLPLLRLNSPLALQSHCSRGPRWRSHGMKRWDLTTQRTNIHEDESKETSRGADKLELKQQLKVYYRPKGLKVSKSHSWCNYKRPQARPRKAQGEAAPPWTSSAAPSSVSAEQASSSLSSAAASARLKRL